MIVHRGDRDIDAARRDLRAGRQIAVDAHDVRQAVVREPLGDRLRVHAVAQLQGDRRILRIHLALRADCDRQRFGDVAAERDDVDGRHAGLHAEELHQLGRLAIRVARLVFRRSIGAGQRRRQIAAACARLRSVEDPMSSDCIDPHAASVAARTTVHNSFSHECVRFHCRIPYSTGCLLRFDAAEPRIVAARLQRDDRGLIAQVAPVPAVLPGERRDERAVRFARALLDLVAAIVARGPFAFGRLAVKLEVHRSALHAPRVEHRLAHRERRLVFQLFATGQVDLDVAAVVLARMRVHHFGDRLAGLAGAERVEPDEPADAERIDRVLRRQHECDEDGGRRERSDESADAASRRREA